MRHASNRVAKAKARKRKPDKRARLAKLMRGIDYCMMITHGPRKLLHARPMSNNGEVDFTGDAWFFTSKGTRKVSELKRSSQVLLSYVGGTRGSPIWIAVTGTARLVTDEDQKRELWMPELDQWFENGPDDPDVLLIHVRASHAAWWGYEDQGEVAL